MISFEMLEWKRVSLFLEGRTNLLVFLEVRQVSLELRMEHQGYARVALKRPFSL